MHCCGQNISAARCGVTATSPAWSLPSTTGPYLARLNGDKAVGKSIVLNWRFTDTAQNYVLNLKNSALTHMNDAQAAAADATLMLTRVILDEITLQKRTFPAAVQSAQIMVPGKREKLGELLAMLDAFPPRFPVVEPRPAR